MSTATRLSTFTNDGLTFEVIDEGPLDGPVIVALHGFPERADTWSGVIPILSDAGFRVLAPNQRGYSPDARPKGIKNYTIDRLAADILALADQAGVAKFHVLGHDWGAAVAWQLAGRHSKHIRSVSALSVPPVRALLRALPRGQVLLSWYMGFFQIPKLPEWTLTVHDSWILRKVLGPSEDMSDALITKTVALSQEPGAITAAMNWYRALRFWVLARPQRIHAPVLFIWGNQDSAIGRAAAVGARKCIDGPYRFEVLDGTSHWIPEERPSETAALVIQHINQHAQNKP